MKLCQRQHEEEAAKRDRGQCGVVAEQSVADRAFRRPENQLPPRRPDAAPISAIPAPIREFTAMPITIR